MIDRSARTRRRPAAPSILVAASLAMSCLATGCSGSSAPAPAGPTSSAPRTEARAPSTAAAVPPTASRSGAPALGCLLTAQQVARAVGRPMRGPQRGISARDCGYTPLGAAKGQSQFEVDTAPFPEAGGPKTLAIAKSELEAIQRLGSAKERATERIVDRPDLGRGAFVHAYVLSGLPGGTVEDVTAYLARWQVHLVIPTSRLLRGNEQAWVTKLAGDLPG